MKSEAFDFIFPSRWIAFTLPNSSIPNIESFLHANQPRIAILDSDLPSANPPIIAAMIVPKNRENDWIFTTEVGHFQLLAGSPGISRLILVGNNPSSDESGMRTYTRQVGDYDPDSLQKLEDSLYPFVANFLTGRNKELGRLEISFLRYEDDVVNSMILEKTVCPIVGEILIEDVEILGSADREFRRRLRFKRMPNLVQSEIKIVNSNNLADSFRDMTFQPDLSSLVVSYLASMAASLSLISIHLQYCIDSGIKPRALCFGVGGGVLIGFLATLGFEVTGIEIDPVVLRIAKQYFGLEQCESVRCSVGDGIDFLKNKGCKKNKFDVIMVDLDPDDFRTDISVPPMEFIQETVLLAAKSRLSESGLLVLNMIPPDNSVYEDLIHMLKKVFVELYKMNTGNGQNFVVVATMSRIDLLCGKGLENAFLTKLKSCTAEAFMENIQKI